MIKQKPNVYLLALIAGLLSLAGCASHPPQRTQFYRLNTSTAAPQTPAEAAAVSATQPLLGVAPVRLASYLDRPQMIHRVSPYRLELRDFHHWAGKLQDNIGLVLVDALQAYFGNAAVVGYPWHRAVRPSYELSLDVSRLDTENQQLLLYARWTLVQEAMARLLDLQQARIVEPLQGEGPEAEAAAASRALQRLAAQIAGRLSSRLE
jgi:uncharacterized lipoprotein YmbA